PRGTARGSGLASGRRDPAHPRRNRPGVLATAGNQRRVRRRARIRVWLRSHGGVETSAGKGGVIPPTLGGTTLPDTVSPRSNASLNHSYAIALSTLTRAARIAGSTAAAAPTRAARRRYVPICVHGRASSVMPSSARARTTAVP